MSELASICPCKDCEFMKMDKEPPSSICYQCDKRIYYDLSLTDPRLIPDYFKEDIERIKKLKEVKIQGQSDKDERKCYTPSWQIDEILNAKAVEDGFNEGYLPWLKHLRNEKRMTFQNIATLCGIGYTAVRMRLKNEKKPYDSRRIIDYEDRYCEYCKKLLVRKRYMPPPPSTVKKYRYKISGLLEANKIFLSRKYCDRKCAALHRAQIIKGEKK